MPSHPLPVPGIKCFSALFTAVLYQRRMLCELSILKNEYYTYICSSFLSSPSCIFLVIEMFFSKQQLLPPIASFGQCNCLLRNPRQKGLRLCMSSNQRHSPVKGTSIFWPSFRSLQRESYVRNKRWWQYLEQSKGKPSCSTSMRWLWYL